MTARFSYSYQSVSLKRIALHVLFWLAIWGLTAFIYGYAKYDVSLALLNNLCFLPIHIAYFYILSYVLIPKFLFNKRYFVFFSLLIVCVFAIPMVTRLVDIFVVEPRLDAYLKSRGLDMWPKVNGTFWERFTDPVAYVNALKGANLVVWFAVVIKFFKLWYERHHAALQSELNFLKGQIHPHFLFNTLNNLYALTLNNSPKSPQIVLGLSEILRYMLYECNVESVPLKKDLDILDSFIMIEQLRYEERLDLSFTKSGEIESHQIAPLLLLPLVENAFKHGAGEKVGEAWINIDLSLKGELLKFKISNSKADVAHVKDGVYHGNIGLENVKKRLQIIYPQGHDLKVFDEEEVFAVILEIDLYKRVNL